MRALLQKLKLLAEWFLDWAVLPWFQPNPGKKRDKRRDAGQP